MDAYKYNHGPRRHMLRHALIILLITAFVAGGVAEVVAWNNSRHHKRRHTTTGATTLVPQQITSAPTTTVDEPLFTMKLPADWKPVDSSSHADDHSVTWTATLKGADNRTLAIYTDVVPTTLPVNRELPVIVHDNQLSYGQISDNCSNFTPGGTLDVGKAEALKPAVSVWQGVNFICNLPNVIENQVGTGSMAGVNTLTVTGPTKGQHKYFFLYTDHNIQPDYTILNDALQSFRAK